MTLTDTWIRVFEAGTKGVSFLVISWFLLYVLLDKRSGHRTALSGLAIAWFIVGAGSLNTALCIVLQRPVWIAFGNVIPAALLLLMAAWLVLQSAELRESWKLWSDLVQHAKTPEVDEVSIRLRKVNDTVWTRIARRRRSKDVTTTGDVGSAPC